MNPICMEMFLFIDLYHLILFFKENVTYPVWAYRSLVSKDPIFFYSRDPIIIFLILRTR